LSELRETWNRLKSWQGGVWLPVLPPLGALVELAVLVAVIEFADWVLPGVDVSAMEPSPYWIPVLLLSLQYGTVAGLMAAAAATLAHVFNGFPDQGVGENFFTYFMHVWSLPILWTGVSLLVGQFRLRQIEVKQDLNHKLNERTKESESLAAYVAGLEARCMGLERQIATRASGPAATILEALAHLDNPAADLSSVLAVIRDEAFPGGALSIFTLTAHGLEVIARCGWEDGAGWQSEIAAAEPLYRAIVAEKRTVSVLNSGDEATLFAQGLAAGPIFGFDGARVIGMVKLERARASEVTAATADRLEVIARLVAPRIAEPRIVIDNEQKRAGEGFAGRVSRGFRQVAWRGLSTSRPQNSESGDGIARVDIVPRVQK
jgi:polysaccharide biosynthesis protein PelD